MGVDGNNGGNNLKNEKKNEGNIHKTVTQERNVIYKMVDKMEKKDGDG